MVWHLALPYLLPITYPDSGPPVAAEQHYNIAAPAIDYIHITIQIAIIGIM